MSDLMRQHEMTEEDIKLQFITPAIEGAGWDRQRQIRMEYNFTDGRVIVRGNVTARGRRKRTDYLLYYNATQIGLTATPKETKEVSNISYFGEPIYTYSLKQGIDDGFLAPYKVLRVGLNRDLEGWRPVAGQRDIYGYEIDDREYCIGFSCKHMYF